MHGVDHDDHDCHVDDVDQHKHEHVDVDQLVDDDDHDQQDHDVLDVDIMDVHHHDIDVDLGGHNDDDSYAWYVRCTMARRDGGHSELCWRQAWGQLRSIVR